MSAPATFNPGLLGKLFPGWARDRAMARFQLEQIETGRKFAASLKDRFTQDWLAPTESADAVLKDSLETLRNRSRDLTGSDPHASAMVEQMIASVAGGRVRIQGRCVGDDPAKRTTVMDRWRIFQPSADRANRDAEYVFETISRSIDGGRMTFQQFVRLGLRQWLECGETLYHLGNQRRKGPGASRLTTVATFIEPDRLMTPADLATDPRCRMGVYYDDENRHPVKYFIAKAHPGDVGPLSWKSTQFDEYDAADIVHCFDPRRPGQSRGYPWLTPVMTYLRHKQKSMEAEMVAQRFAACICAFIKTPQPATVASAMGTTTTSGEKETQLKPGKVWHLDPNQDVTFGNPTRPGEMWVPSQHEILRAIGTAVGMPYVVLANDFENVNYSSFRAAIMSLHRFVATWRVGMDEGQIAPLWRRVYDEAVLIGEIRAPGYALRRMDYQRHRVQWPGLQWVDPWREVQADVLSVRSGLLPKEYILSKYGLDLEEVTMLLKEQEELGDAAGLPSMLETQATQPGPDPARDIDIDPDADVDGDLFADRLRRNGHNGRIHV